MWTWTPWKSNLRDLTFETSGNVSIDFRTLFVTWYKIPVWFDFCTCFASAVSVRSPTGHASKKCKKIAGCWEYAVHGTRPPIASGPGLSPPERPGLNYTTSQLWSDTICPRTTSWSAYLRLSHSFCLRRQDKVLEAVVQGQVVSDHDWRVILSRPGRSGGDEPSFEAIRGWEPYTAHSYHPAIFWQFSNFLRGGSLHKLTCWCRYKKVKLTKILKSQPMMTYVQPVTFGVSFLHAQISVDDLVL